MLKLSIRLDDITEKMDWKKFLRFKELLDNYGVKPLIGVVPQNEDPKLDLDEGCRDISFDEYIRKLEEEGWSVAMHGVSHTYTTKKGGLFPLNSDSEFAGLPYEEQYELLGYGVDLLNGRGISTDIFMAPSHSYDKNTLKALKELGFSSVTDGFGETPYIYNGMNFYPISFKRSQTLKKSKGYSCFVYHTNTMNEKDFEAFEKLLSEGNKPESNYKVISFSEYLSVTPVRRSAVGHWGEFLLAKGKHLISKIF